MPRFLRSSFPSMASVGGHIWTLSSFASRSLSRPILPPARPLVVPVRSDLGPPVELTAALHEVSTVMRPALGQSGEDGPASGRRPLLVLVHGLGGNADSGYVKQVASVAAAVGLSSLRLNLRGADPTGWDFYHAGLTEDIVAVLKHPALAPFDELRLLGFSLGGHVVLKLATETSLRGRVTAVSAVCPPLDLAESSAAFDAPNLWPYRAHVLRGLKAMYSRFLSHAKSSKDAEFQHRLNALRLPDARRARAIDRLGEWDEHVVARRHGFANARAYYEAQRVSTRLSGLEVPSLVVTARWDPMVPHSTTASFLGETLDGGPAAWTEARVSPYLSHWQLQSGGHVAWPTPAAPARSVVHHVLDWLAMPRR